MGTPPMEAGRDLDRLVAEQVMGWLVVVPDGGENWYDRQVTAFPCLIQHREGGQWLTRTAELGTTDHDSPWAPSVDIRAAWEVVERLRADDWLVSIKAQPAVGAFVLEGSRSEYDAPAPDQTFGRGLVACEATDMRSDERPWRLSEIALAETAPLAICRCALKLVGASPPVEDVP